MPRYDDKIRCQEKMSGVEHTYWFMMACSTCLVMMAYTTPVPKGDMPVGLAFRP